MTDMQPEVVPPSNEPDAAVSTGSGRDAQGATPPPESSASTSGLGPQSEQKGASAKGGAPYSLTDDVNSDDQPPQSPSGT